MGSPDETFFAALENSQKNIIRVNISPRSERAKKMYANHSG